jgi:hypothetical protein
MKGKIAWVLLAGALALAEVKVPPINPQINGTFPRGGQRGTDVQITIQGRNLQDTSSIHFDTPKLSALVTNADP